MTLTITPDIEQAIDQEARKSGKMPEAVAQEGLRKVFLPNAASPSEILEMFGKVYDGLSQEEIQQLERIAFDRSQFFTDRSQS